MTGVGTQTRLRFEQAMQTIAIGATLARRQTWTVIKQRHFDTSVDLTLRRGRRTIRLSVSISIHGPDLFDAGLRPVALAPTQRELLLMEAA